MLTRNDSITTTITTDLIRGAIELEPSAHGVLPHRLPAWARAQCTDPRLALSEAEPSGVRLVFRSRATVLELDTLPTRRTYLGSTDRHDGIYDVLVDDLLVAQASVSGGNTITTDLATGTTTHQTGPVGTLRVTELPDRMKNIEIWLPYNETTELVALRTNAPIEATPDRGRRVWLHHGSSISHGSNAASPTTIWPALSASRGGVDLINLGLGGSALLDQFTARVLRDTPADLISIKIGINLVNTDAMRLRSFTSAMHGFLDTIRDGHPTTPLLVVSPIYCPIHENTPGPSAFDLSALRAGKLIFRSTGDPAEHTAGKLTLRVIRAELADIVAQRAAEDPHLHHLDGRALYGKADSVELPLPDRLHPDTITHQRIGERFAELIFGADGPFEYVNLIQVQ